MKFRVQVGRGGGVGGRRGGEWGDLFLFGGGGAVQVIVFRHVMLMLRHLLRAALQSEVRATLSRHHPIGSPRSNTQAPSATPQSHTFPCLHVPSML